jgi:hypothetical protein
LSSFSPRKGEMYLKHVSLAEKPEEGKHHNNKRENTNWGNLDVQSHISRFYMYLILRAVNVFIDTFRL